MRASLRFDPLNCVVTILSGDGDDAQVLEVFGPGSEVVRSHRAGREHFADVCGSVVYVGAYPPGTRRLMAAAVLDLPDGRSEAVGNAVLVPSGGGLVQALCELKTLDGQDVSLRLICRGAALVSAELSAS